MKYAADFREQAREALRGNWLTAAGTGFVAALMGAGIATGGGSSGSNSNNSNHNDSFSNMMHGVSSQQMWQILSVILVILVLVLVIWAIVTLVIGGAGKLGYATYNLNLIDGKTARFADLFSQFHRIGDGIWMNILVGLYTFLWSLLFVIPGIIKQYSYAMTPYILAENPGMTATDAITESRRIMDGNKWRLFCLRISFIGWSFLCSLPAVILLAILLGNMIRTGNLFVLLWIIPAIIPTFIGVLFLRPYEEAAQAAFYREVAGTPAETWNGSANADSEPWLEF